MEKCLLVQTKQNAKKGWDNNRIFVWVLAGFFVGLAVLFRAPILVVAIVTGLAAFLIHCFYKRPIPIYAIETNELGITCYHAEGSIQLAWQTIEALSVEGNIQNEGGITGYIKHTKGMPNTVDIYSSNLERGVYEYFQSIVTKHPEIALRRNQASL